MMATVFECLGCGEESNLMALPAKCPNCGSGNGVLREAPQPASTPPAPEASPPADK
jgi:Zn finger protein HypA/HybF involved in hydrogenase expression